MAHASQLVRYFHVSNARIGVLTNGREWHFYTDLDKPKIMDDRPFLRLDLLDIDPYILPDLKKLTKDTFDLDSVLLAAEELKYVSALKRAIAQQFENPSDELVKLLAGSFYDRMFTMKVRELFTRLTAKALTQFINDSVNSRLKSALGGAAPAVGAAPQDSPASPAAATPEVEDGIETTLEEIEGFHIVRAIVASELPFSRVVSRDQKSYFGILVDDNNRKPVC